QLSVPTAKAGSNENTLIEYFFIPLLGGGFKPNFSVISYQFRPLKPDQTKIRSLNIFSSPF
ncbi:MAG: hypothetical protein SWX82_26480, partial [Cyanobacteriota bacterium]|nr:hypothetical protein [Cyanobacteriota bacterium]